jgi:hypothetical protein
MWEYYNRGYEPGWIKGGELTERIEVREKLENIGAELKPCHIIYFEDPFGRTKYERREGLEREIGTIIDTVKQVEDVYVILTSREEVFKEFEKEKISVKELKEFERKLNIKKSSYNYERRKEILLMWAEAENCRWFRNDKLKELVLASLKNEKVLLTPLSIKDFAVATFDIEKESELREKIEEKSKETAKAFAEEIKNMSTDKIAFLSFPFISSFEVEFVRATYQELVKELNLEDAWGFDRVLKWFRDDKVDSSGNYIYFSHPSYSEALPYLLIEDGYITQINKMIFSKLLLKLAEKDAAVVDVARAVTRDFDRLPDVVRNELLLKLAEKGAAAGVVAWTVADNFDRLPDNVGQLLFKLAEKNVAAGDIARAAARNFDRLPDVVRNELLLKLAEKDAAAGDVAVIVADNFDRLPDVVRNELLLKLAEKDAVAWIIARAVADNFDRLPDTVRQLLFKLAEKDVAVGDVAWIVADNFDRLPDTVRNELLLKLAEKDAAVGDVAWIVADNFDRLPDAVKNLLFKLLEKDAAAGHVARAVADNFDRLPDVVRNELLLKLAEKDVATWEVARAVADNFDRLPDAVRNLLDRLQKPLELVIRCLSYDKWSKEEALDLISNALPKLNRDFVLKILNELSKCEHETVRIIAAKMLNDIFCDSEAKKEY